MGSVISPNAEDKHRSLMRNHIRRLEADTPAFIRVTSVSVQEFKNVLRKSEI